MFSFAGMVDAAEGRLPSRRSGPSGEARLRVQDRPSPTVVVPEKCSMALAPFLKDETRPAALGGRLRASPSDRLLFGDSRADGVEGPTFGFR